MQAVSRLSIYTDPIFYRHDTGVGHPETADRLDAALEGVRRAGLSQQLVSESSLDEDVERIITKVHSPSYAREFELACRTGQRLLHSLDNPISSLSFNAARAAVGTAMRAASDVWKNDLADRAFIIARPPGHHAERAAAMGFCFFNTIACVAEWLRERPGIDRVFIFDWDVHHGNGTQDLFYSRDDVFYASIHQFPFYPGSGAANERGEGAGKGFTKNIPMLAGAGDVEYLATVENHVLRLIDEYRPNAILISAGFDAHDRDPLAGMRVTSAGFGEMTERIAEAAARHTGGRLLSLLEGGYDPQALTESVAEHLLKLA
jgi:acetoin utilization deacetylase AcuC-like enzyme